MIRVIVVDDSIFMRTAMIKMLESSPDIRVIDVAGNGEVALEKIRKRQPDVVTMDLEMPGMSGIEAIHFLTSESSIPIIVVSSFTEEGATVTLEALSKGAFDYIPKQLNRSPIDIMRIQKELIAKIHAAYIAGQKKKKVAFKNSYVPETAVVENRQSIPQSSKKKVQLVVIGASTGGPKALQRIISGLPDSIPVPILIVVHMPVAFTRSFAERMNQLTKIDVMEIESSISIESNKIYIAKGGMHCILKKNDAKKMFYLSEKPEDSVHRPSVDVTMKSAAEIYDGHLMGIILTGMGKDGLVGMQAIHDLGGITIAQDEATSVVYGMPRVCVENRVVDHILPIEKIVQGIISQIS